MIRLNYTDIKTLESYQITCSGNSFMEKIFRFSKMEFQTKTIRLQLLYFIIVTPIVLYLDSVPFSRIFPYGQWIVNFCTLTTFAWFYYVADKRVQGMMLLMLLISSCGEIVGSLILKFYVYRLENIPLYVPFGHALVFASAYYIYQQTLIQQYADKVQRLLFFLALLISVFSLLFLQDTCGFICFLTFCLLRKNNKLFYSCMFFVVLYLELIGTYLQTWTWYGKLNNHPDWIIGCNNPPCGIGGLYMIFDVLVTFCYFQLNAIHNRE